MHLPIVDDEETTRELCGAVAQRARLEQAMREVDLQQENRLLCEQINHGQPGFGKLSGLSPKMQKVYKTNPLTGILGNAELLLSEVRRKDDGRLPQGGQVKLETIAALAVRLRETVRRLCQEWETAQSSSNTLK